MRYHINFDKTINQLVPWYMRGRNLILYLQALMSPLRILNDEFVAYAKEKRIEVAMTSQVFIFEWYLNRKFGQYFANEGRISIKNSEPIGVALYDSGARVPAEDLTVVRKESESGDHLVLYKDGERSESLAYSFKVCSPPVNTALISREEYLAMLKHTIDKYRIANKTYIIELSA